MVRTVIDSNSLDCTEGKPVPSVLGLITARGGSKGIPGKNIRMIGGKPLIAWSINAALASVKIKRLIVSTDAPEIAEVALHFGAEVPFLRPAALALDNSPHLDVVLHALDWLKANGESFDYVMLLQPTSPLRLSEDIDSAINVAVASLPAAVISVNELHQHPYFTRVMDDDGVLSPLIPMKELEYPRRQDLPPAYYINGAIFLNQVDSLRNDRTFYPSGAKGFLMPAERSWQIDTDLDIAVVAAILNQQSSSTPSERSQ
jgi:CMP-N,N'-diacetyllegionaminic acid synthase